MRKSAQQIDIDASQKEIARIRGAKLAKVQKSDKLAKVETKKVKKILKVRMMENEAINR